MFSDTWALELGSPVKFSFAMQLVTQPLLQACKPKTSFAAWLRTKRALYDGGMTAVLAPATAGLSTEHPQMRELCELCEASGVALRPYPVPPEGEVPQVETCVFVCDICREQLEHPKRIDAAHWRCACQSVWSEVPAVQVVAARVLDRLGKTELWAREAREAAYFDEEVELWIGQDSL